MSGQGKSRLLANCFSGLAAWLFALGGYSASPSTAAAATPIMLPTNGKPTAAGLTLVVDPTWVDHPGYRPVRITVQCKPPAAADRTLSVYLTTESWAGSHRTTSAAADIEIPAGSTGVSVTLPVLQLTSWQSLAINVSQDGQQVDALSTRIGGIGVYVGGDSGGLSLLLIQDVPQPFDLAAFFRPAGMPGPNPAALLGSRIADLPGEWIDYTCLDLIAISAGDVEQMARANPRAWQAIRTWVAAGGNLCVYDLGDDFQRLADLDASLGDVPAGRGEQSSQRWMDFNHAVLAKPANPSGLELRSLFEVQTVPVPDFGIQTSDAALIDGSGATVDGSVAQTPELADPATKKEPLAQLKPDRQVFRLRPLGLGRIVALSAADAFPAGDGNSQANATTQWREGTNFWLTSHWIADSLGADRLLWSQRLGLTYQSPDPDFWNFMIPGVGLPPVTAYRVLITLFVVLIGPVNYWLLRRYRRLHLLLFIVPASAALVTVGLLSYALFSDGLGTRLRARSYTQLDQRRGESVSWSRLAYYAGLAPYGGLDFPRDVAIFPLEFEPGESDIARLHETSWDDRQRLTRGWLPARTLTQFVAVRSGADRRALEITPAGDKLQLVNHLQAGVSQALVADDAGRLFYVSNLAPGATGLAAPLAKDDGSDGKFEIPAALRAAMTSQGLGDAPLPMASQDVLGMRPRAYYPKNTMPNPVQNTSLLELELRRVRSIGAEATGSLPARSYLVISDRSDPALLGAASAQEAASFHVIEGQW
jgi:hypothetical protein